MFPWKVGTAGRTHPHRHRKGPTVTTTTTKAKASARTINGIDTAALQNLVDRVKADPAQGIARFGVSSAWKGGTRTDTRVESWWLGGRRFTKDFTISVDEPGALLGKDDFANPQEYLMASVNACIMATYVAACSVNGIRLDRLELETTGELDLRGFLAIDASVPPGYEHLDVTVHIRGDGTPEQFRQIHEFVKRTSPNFYNLARPVRVEMKLETR
jgi:uncharacterized OsmC-like protein